MTDREHINRIIDEALWLCEVADRVWDCTKHGNPLGPVRNQLALHSKSTVAAIRDYQEFRKLCQRCEKRPRDGSGIMCGDCWIETGEGL